ncbi:MAG: hypothetical protein KatS3mg057_2983 [Herpetosiphonaceae bacterium]|nr:MAG: hypothetical protein KatS3mg057_2983 [Herpetosiphonaceae bacterium]
MIAEEHNTQDVRPGDRSAAQGGADSTIEQLIDALEDALADGRRLFFTRRLLVDEERFLDLIDRLRVAVPDELRVARRVVQEQQRILKETQARVEKALSEQGLLQIAEEERERIISQAKAEADRIKAEADDYARQVLLDLEERVGKVLTIIQNGLDTLGYS